MIKRLLDNNVSKVAIKFSFSTILMSIVNMLSGILIIRWLLPKDIGLWNSLILIQSYILFAQLGIFNGLNRELPFLLGQNNKELAIKYAQTAGFVARALMIGTIIIGLLVLPFIYLHSNNWNVIFSLIVLIISISFNFLQNYLTVTFRSNQSFEKLTKIYLVQSLILVTTVLFVYYFNYKGFLIRQIIIVSSLLILCYLGRPLKIKSFFSKLHFISLLKIGFPFFSMGYAQTITNSFTRIAILSFSNIIFVGIFSPALAVSTAIMMIPSSISQYISPKMSYKYGLTGIKKDLWKYVQKSTIYIIIIMIPIVITGYFILPYFIINFFPNYQQGIFASQIVLISGLFFSITICNNSLISIRANKPFLFLTIYKFISYFIIIFLFGYYCENILNGVAIGLMISEICFGVISLITCYIVLNK